MGQQQNKYHIDDKGDIFRINEDDSFTYIGNASQLDALNFSKARNWLYIISLIFLIWSGIICISDCCYKDSAMLGMLSLCAGITAIVFPWIFKTVSKFWIVIYSLLLIVALVMIICFSYEELYPTQIALCYISLLTFIIACAKRKSSKQLNKPGQQPKKYHTRDKGDIF